MKALEALYYLDDIAHGRKMIHNPHELELIIEKDLKTLEIIKEIMIVKEHEGYVEFTCEYSIHKKYKKKIDLLKEVLL